MNIKKMISAAATACAAQGVAFVVSVVMSLVIPKLLGVTSYGYWQLFVFYAGYSGFFHFGLNDGIYLVEGGRCRQEIDKNKVASQFWSGIAAQLVVACFISLFAVFTAPGPDRSFVLFAFAAYTAIFNTSGLLGYLFQAMNETKKFSYMTMLERGVFLVPLLLFVAFGQSNYKLLVLSYIFSRSVALGYAIWMARDIIFVKLLPPCMALKECVGAIRVGFSLMIANIADMLIMGIARMFVDSAWGISAFGRVSFSLSIVNFFITFVAQASMVLFPALRQGSLAERKAFFRSAGGFMDLLFPAAFLFYFPAAVILESWLPDYASSMRYFAMLMPMCMYNAKMLVLCQTYYKVLRKERALLLVTCTATLASGIVSLLGIYLLNSLDAVLMGAVSVIVLRTTISERYLSKELEVPISRLSIQGIIVSAVFVLATLALSRLQSLAVYSLVYAAYLYVNRSDAIRLMGSIRRAIRRA